MILVLGGTAEARELAAELDRAGVPVTTLLAGRVANPRLPPGNVRVGGFGGPAALAGWLREHGVAAFAATDAWFLLRCVEPPDPPLPARHALLLDRGPYTLADERSLIERFAIDVVVTKDSGGTLTEAKLDAARERGLPVIVVDRPPRPAMDAVATVAEAVSWARRHSAGACRRTRSPRAS